MRLAHFSDVHLTVPPLGQAGNLLSKRMAGVLNYYAGGRGRHFHDARTRIARLLEDVDRAQPEHVLCTGDLTQMSWQAEFEEVAALFGDRLEQPERYSVLPGNHDRYTGEAVRQDLFGRLFGQLAAPDGRYPHVKRIGDRVSLVLVDAARATSLVDSSGLVGPEQLARLQEVLTDPSLASEVVVLALHYGLFRADGRPDRPWHGLRDHAAFVELLDRPDVHLDLVLHGHMHRPYVVRTARRLIACVGSATDLHAGGGWHLLELDPDTRRLTLERREWSEEEGRYLPTSKPIPGWPAQSGSMSYSSRVPGAFSRA